MLSLFQVTFGGYDVKYPANFRWAGSDLGIILTELVKYIFALAGFALIFFLIKGGFELMTSAGDEKKMEAGKNTITSSIFGFVIVFASYWIYEITTYVLVGGPFVENTMGGLWAKALGGLGLPGLNPKSVDIGSSYITGSGSVSRFSTLSVFVNPLLRNSFLLSSVIFFLLIVGGGLFFIFNAGKGEQEGIAKNKSFLTAALLGFIIIFAAYWIVEIFQFVTGLSIFSPPV